MDYLVTFLEGIVTFVSPCLLPMLPVYLAYVAGGVGAAGSADGDAHRGTWRAIVGALCFVAGFAAVFTVLGAFAGTLGGLLVSNQRAIDVVCGLVVIVLGLNYLGIIRVPLLDRTLKPGAAARPAGLLGSFVFGVVFALGWTPCVGTFLASALSLAATSGSTLRGVTLLLAYSAGLGLPFVLCAVLMEQLGSALAWAREHARQIEVASGVLLVVVGLLMAAGVFGAWLRVLVG